MKQPRLSICFFLACLAAAGPSPAAELPDHTPPKTSAPVSGLYPALKRKIDVKASVQSALEWDNNVLKTFQNTKQDGLFRLLFKIDGAKDLSPSSQLGAGYMAGGKKYFRATEKDKMIQDLTPFFEYRLSPRVQFLFATQVKGQLERRKRDADQLDVNEDFLLAEAGQNWRFALGNGCVAMLDDRFEAFYFGVDRPYDYRRQRHQLELRKHFSPRLSQALSYNFYQQIFTRIDRQDLSQAVSVDFRYYHSLLLQLGYTFQHNSSNSDIYEFNSHRLDLLWTWPVALGSYLVTLNVMGSLQLKKYPPIYRSGQEGQRLLMTDAENENFNSLVAKLSGPISENCSWEAKFSRYSSGLSSTSDTFSRTLVSAGVRFDF